MRSQAIVNRRGWLRIQHARVDVCALDFASVKRSRSSGRGLAQRNTLHVECGIVRQIVDGVKDGGRYRIRTYDFHRVRMALYR